MAHGVRAAGALSASLRLRVLLLSGTNSPRGDAQGVPSGAGSRGRSFQTFSLPLSEAVMPSRATKLPPRATTVPLRATRLCWCGAVGAPPASWCHCHPWGVLALLGPPAWAGVLPPKSLSQSWGSTPTMALGMPNWPPAPSPSFGALRGHRALVPVPPSPGGSQ